MSSKTTKTAKSSRAADGKHEFTLGATIDADAVQRNAMRRTTMYDGVISDLERLKVGEARTIRPEQGIEAQRFATITSQIRKGAAARGVHLSLKKQRDGSVAMLRVAEASARTRTKKSN